MPHPARVLPLLTVLLLPVFGADAPTAPPEGRGRGAGGRGNTPAAVASDWIDKLTGHRVIRLSPDTGGSSLYFHQHSYTPEGDKVIIRGAGGIGVVDISALGKTPPKFEVVLENASPIATAWRTREAYYVDRASSSLMARST